jgi:hypothetical protein
MVLRIRHFLEHALASWDGHALRIALAARVAAKVGS